MWDFRKFPDDKVEATRKILDGTEFPGEFKSYTAIPASERLLVAEKVYRVLGRDDVFWSDFYRLLGFYYASEEKPGEAARARRRALELIDGRLAGAQNYVDKKELLVLSASMHHFLGDDPTALKELTGAGAIVVPPIGDEKMENKDAYLSSLIKEFIPAIKSNKVPEGF
jgi:hypothetical protein